MSRAINITNSEISMVLWIIGFIMQLVVIKQVWDLHLEFPGVIEFVMMLFLLPMASLFFFMSPAWINYLISKHNLFLWIDKITNPDYIGWVRATRSRQLRNHIVKKGPLGQTKGRANGVKADVINKGDYTLTLPNGNQAIIKNDLLSTNVNLEHCMHWQMVKKHHGLVGYNAWAKALSDGELTFENVEVLNE